MRVAGPRGAAMPSEADRGAARRPSRSCRTQARDALEAVQPPCTGPGACVRPRMPPGHPKQCRLRADRHAWRTTAPDDDDRSGDLGAQCRFARISTAGGRLGALLNGALLRQRRYGSSHRWRARRRRRRASALGARRRAGVAIPLVVSMKVGGVSSVRCRRCGGSAAKPVIEGVVNRRVPARSPVGRPFGPSAVRRLTAAVTVD
jgi:hypothetical protein